MRLPIPTLRFRSRRSPIASLEAIYALLSRVIPSQGPSDYAALATTSSIPAATARVRYVVLRGFEPRQHQLWINTNRSSQKVQQLRQSPAPHAAELVLWLARPKIQLRLLAHWQLIEHPAATPPTPPMPPLSPALLKLYQHAWQAQPFYARQLYKDSPLQPIPHTHSRIPTDFCVLLGTLHAIDALRLTIPTHEQYTYERHADRWVTVPAAPGERS